MNVVYDFPDDDGAITTTPVSERGDGLGLDLAGLCFENVASMRRTVRPYQSGVMMRAAYHAVVEIDDSSWLSKLRVANRENRPAAEVQLRHLAVFFDDLETLHEFAAGAFRVDRVEVRST